MRIPLVLALLAMLAGCATNPLKDARFWKLDQCAGAPNATVRFPGREAGSTIALIPRDSCLALSRAEAKIGSAANLHADRIQIADMLTPNAFVARDANNLPVITVTLGMLKALGPDEASWAALLGHEIAHLVRKHSEGRKEAEAAAQVGGQVVANLIGLFVPGIGGALAGTVGGTATQMAMYGAYTRPQEAEADQMSLRWMVSAGYDPRGMERLFELLAKEGAGLPGFLSTHPGAGDRAQMVRKFIDSGTFD
jgi:predicted Zn-dependent protease